MPEADLIKLYSKKILALATSIPHQGHLDTPDGSASKRAPLCGSVVSVDIGVEDGRITQFAQDVKACALGQATAAVVGTHVIGRSRAEVQTARDQLAAMLKEGGPTPDAPFEDLEVMLPARDYGNRHGSILLSLDATLAALDDAARRACA
ncbi:iron-sulfur cluster assembly scaffold protein [Qingshengfaniella alkalisoli]|uniref:Iron-sulfur cluster assembly scaffold protein n=1 Tax=Qingshengfaniella alkalisoli TaxID=2599296 RepID=A0A5B8I8R9_9RHOB|nr:iron-sulfur cluster assembly scaffold protein [Qingshengfaniella alkalisoli]QDY69166.1 iron-sulfur cluster assembly scaffold protein [Qingshengfaniella alkalisoli]